MSEREPRISYQNSKGCRVSETVYGYFLDVLPPRWMGGTAFVFAEGDEPRPHLFWRASGAYYAQRFDASDLHQRLGRLYADAGRGRRV